MKKTIILISILIGQLFIAPFSLATDYAVCGAGAITTIAYNTVAANCGTADANWATVNSPGNSIFANNLAVTIATGVNWDLGTGKLSTEVGAGSTAGGSFTMSGSNTATSNVTAGESNCLTLATNATLDLTGNVTSATTNGASGISLSNSGCTLTVHGNVSGNPNANTLAHGISSSGAVGSITIDGNITGGGAVSALGVYISGGATGTVDGTVTGGTAAGADGIRNLGTGAFTITGLMVNTATSSAASGRITVTPTNATKYIRYGDVYYSAGISSDVGGTAVTAANTAAQIATSSYFVKKDSGVNTQGAASSGGGAWGF